MVKVKEILTKDPEEFQYLKMGKKRKKRKKKRMSSSLVKFQVEEGEMQTWCSETPLETLGEGQQQE